MDTAVIDRAGGTASGWSARRTSVTVAALIGVALVATVAVRGLTSNDPAAPYPASAVQARLAHLQPVGSSQSPQAIADRLAGPGRLSAPVASALPGRPQELIGQLTFRTPAQASSGDRYALFVIDQDHHRPVPGLWASAPSDDVTSGWSGVYTAVAARYPWLSALASVRTDDGSLTDPGAAVEFAATARGPVTFAAVLEPGSLPIADPDRQLLVALVLIGPGDRVDWATRVRA